MSTPSRRGCRTRPLRRDRPARGNDLVTASEWELEAVPGKEIAMIFQDPISSLSPVQRIGAQIVEQIQAHEQISKAAALDRAVGLMERVGIPRAWDRARACPQEFSGGMRQRIGLGEGVAR